MKAKKLLSVLTAALLLLGVLPLSAFAASPTLALDTPLTLVPGMDTAEVTFTPAETGVYEFRSETVDESNQANPDLNMFADGECVQKLTGDNNWNGNDFFLVYRLIGGKTYTLSVTDLLASITGLKITVTKAETKPLAMNTPLAVVPGNELAYVTFTPEKDGEYAFSSAAESDTDPYLRGMDTDGDEKVYFISGQPDDYDGFHFWASYKLRAGYTYTLALFDYNASVEGFTVTVTEYHELLTQPTAGTPTVKATTPEKAAFQWYQVEMVTAPLTDDNSALVSAYGYDDTAGQWTGDDRGDNYWLMDIWLTSGESLTVKSADKILVEDCTAYGYAVGSECEIEALDANTVRFTSSANMPYEIVVATDGTDDRFTVSHSSPKLGAKIDGQTTATLTKFEKNKYYACVVTYPDGVSLTSQFFKMAPAVAKQPTVADPSVKVTFPDQVKGYQWYQMNINKTAPVTEDDVEDYYNFYDQDSGEWRGMNGMMIDDRYEHQLFAIPLLEGQTVFVETTDTILPDNSYMFGRNAPGGNITPIGEHMLALTATQADIYEIAVATDDYYSRFKVWFGSMGTGVAINGQTSDTLTAYEKDAAYQVKVTYKDGVELASRIFQMIPEIIKQPTAVDPSVKVTLADEVKSYQWYTYEKTPITDQNAKVYEYGGQKATFDSATGVWTGIEEHMGYGDHGYFVVDMKAGEQLLVDPGVKIMDYIGMGDVNTVHWIDEWSVDKDTGLCVLEANRDGSYYLYVSSEDANRVTIKAWLNKTVPVEGQNTDTMTKTESGNLYFCRITYKSGEVLTSDDFEATKTTALVIDAAAADPTDLAAQQALLAQIEEMLKDTTLTADEKAVLGALKIKVEKNIAALTGQPTVNDGTGNSDSDGTGSPNTGVAEPTWLWLALLLLSGSGIAATLLTGKKKPTA